MKKSRLMELAGVVTEAKEKVDCPFCDKKFVTGSLLKHIKSTHKGDYSDMFEDVVITEAARKAKTLTPAKKAAPKKPKAGVINAIAQEFISTAEDMLGDPDNYGLDPELVDGMDLAAAVTLAAKKAIAIAKKG